MKRLSICTSLSGVRPMMTRPIRSGISCTVRPSVATSSRATVVPGSAPEAAAASAVSGSDCGSGGCGGGCVGSGCCGCCCGGCCGGCCCVVGVGRGRALYSTHWSSRTALMMSARVTAPRSAV